MARESKNRAGGQVAQDDSVVSRPGPAESGRVLRVAALVAVAVGLAALTAGACVLSYEPIHRLAIQSGVTPRLATIYPLIFDALLVLAGCSVLALRGAGWISRIYAWLCLLVLLSGLAGGGAVHADGVRFSRKLGAVLAAVIPWVLVLIGFGLLLALLRYARLRRQASRSSYTEQLAEPLSPESPDAVLTTAPVVPAPRTVPADEAPVLNPALAALAVARAQPEPATTPQPAVAAAGPGPAQAGTPGRGTAGTPAAGNSATEIPVTASTVTASSVTGSSVTGRSVTGRSVTGNSVAGTPSPGSASQGTTSPGAPAAQPAGPDLTKSGPPRAPVRQADLQLRARIPRPAPT
ncbi:MAG: DUF2637 domain-containing protein, partial [Streptosporangiaceae bacterium]